MQCDIPDALQAELLELLGPVAQALLVLGKGLLVFFELVLHFDFDAADLVELGGFLVELLLHGC